VYDGLTDGGVAGLVQQFFSVFGFKAPLMSALPLPFYLFFGRHWQVAYLVNVGAMLLLFSTVYEVGRRLANDGAAGAAVAIAATMPLLYGLSRWFLVEYTMTAMVMAVVWLVLSSPDLRSRRACLFVGVLCGFGLLLKASFALFVLVPLGWEW